MGKKYSNKEIDQIIETDEDCSLCVAICTMYFGRDLTYDEIAKIIILSRDFGLDWQVIEYIIKKYKFETLNSINDVNTLTEIAEKYAAKDVHTMEDITKLNEKIAYKDKTYEILTRVYDFFDLDLVCVNENYNTLKKWLNEYNANEKAIIDALQLSLKRTGHASFPYANKILENQNKNKKKTRHPTFDQRTYDCKELERRIIESQNKKFAKKDI